MAERSSSGGVDSSEELLNDTKQGEKSLESESEDLHSRVPANQSDSSRDMLVAEPAGQRDRVHEWQSSGVNSSLLAAHAEDECLHLWQEHTSNLKQTGSTDIFHQNDSLLAVDSGFSDIPELVTELKYFTAVLTIVSTIGNIYAIVVTDLLLVLGEVPDDPDFLATRQLGRLVFGDRSPIHLDRVIPICELLFLAFMILRMIRFACTAILCNTCGHEEDKDISSLVRWSYTAELFWVHLPRLMTFSGMKLLYYVSPAVLGTEAFVAMHTIEQRWEEGSYFHAVGRVLWFLIAHMTCFIIGFDAFLVKFRMAEEFINAEELKVRGVLLSFLFLFQLLSIVNLNLFIRDRLFLFLFAGEDGKLSLKEEDTKDVWVALVAREIFKQLGVFQALVIMLSFDDYDYQMLVLDPGKKIEMCRTPNNTEKGNTVL